MAVTDTAFLEQFSDLADQVIAHRRQTGRVPKEIWLKLLELAGSYLCLEILLVAHAGNLMLKRRHDETATGGEKEWEGKLHIPGLSVTPEMKTRDIVPALLRKEIVKEGEPEDVIKELAARGKIWGFGRYPEPQRKTIADTIIVAMSIEGVHPSRLQDDLVFVQPFELDQVIDQHKPVVEAYFRGEGGFLDL